jgi:hypothetical protein
MSVDFPCAFSPHQRDGLRCGVERYVIERVVPQERMSMATSQYDFFSMASPSRSRDRPH